MQAMLRRLTPVSWPISIKLFVMGLLIAVPILGAFAVLRQESINVALASAQRYAVESAQERQAYVSDTLLQANASMGAFANNATHYAQLLAILEEGAGESVLDDFDLLLQTEFITVRDAVFRSVALLDSSGVVVAASGANVTSMVGRDLTETTLFNVARAAGEINESQTMIVAPNVFGADRSDSAIQTAQIIFGRRGTIVGYLIGEVDAANAFYDAFSPDLGDYLPINTYLLATNGALFAPPAYAQQAQTSQASIATSSVLAETVSADVYSTASGEVYRYFNIVSSLSGSLTLILVSEMDADAPFNANYNLATATNVPLLIAVVALVALVAFTFERLFTLPLRQLEVAAKSAIAGDYDQPLPVARNDEFGSAGVALRDLRQHLTNTVNELEARIARRARDFEATQEISRVAAQQRDTQRLMDEVVDLIIEQFPSIYHAQVFLIDAEERFAMLRASTGEVGKALLSRGHRLAVGSVSVVGQAVAEGQVIITRNTESSQVHRPNVLLPDTRAELAIPLRVGARVIGVLDVQSKSSGSFTEDEIKVLQTMADQVAVAIENARLYEEAVSNLRAIRETSAEGTRRSWEEFVRQQQVQALIGSAGYATDTDLTPLREKALQEDRAIIGELTARDTVPVAVPMRLRGQLLGAVAWELRAQDFTEDKLLLAEELVARLTVSLDIARLFQQSQLAAERERVINEINTRLTSQTDIDEILQTAVREVGQALRAPNVTIQLNRMRRNGKPQTQNNGSANGHHNHQDAEDGDTL